MRYARANSCVNLLWRQARSSRIRLSFHEPEGVDVSGKVAVNEQTVHYAYYCGPVGIGVIGKDIGSAILLD